MNEPKTSINKESKVTPDQKGGKTSVTLNQATRSVPKTPAQTDPHTPKGPSIGNKRDLDKSQDSDKKSLHETIQKFNLQDPTRSANHNANLTTGPKGFPSMMKQKQEEKASPVFPKNLEREIGLVADHHNEGGATSIQEDRSPRSNKGQSLTHIENDKLNFMVASKSPTSHYKTEHQSKSTTSSVAKIGVKLSGGKESTKSEKPPSTVKVPVKDFQSELEGIEINQNRIPGLRVNGKEIRNNDVHGEGGDGAHSEGKGSAQKSDGKGSTQKSTSSRASANKIQTTLQESTSYLAVQKALKQKEDRERSRSVSETRERITNQQQQTQSQQIDEEPENNENVLTQGQQDSNSENRQRYNIDEDATVLEYINQKSKNHDSSFNGINFWKKAVEVDGILEKRRSAESLRNRYKDCLRNLDSNDLERIEKWINEHGRKGFLVFKTQTCQDKNGKKVKLKKLDLIELSQPKGHIPDPKKPKPVEERKHKPPLKKRKQTKIERDFEGDQGVQERRQGRDAVSKYAVTSTKPQHPNREEEQEDDIEDEELDADEDGEDQQIHAEQQQQQSQQSQRAAQLNALVNTMYNDRVTTRSQTQRPRDYMEEEEEEETPHQIKFSQVSGKKRREYDGKYENERQANPPKRMKENRSTENSMGFENNRIQIARNEDMDLNSQDQRKIRRSAQWLKDLSHRYGKDPEEMIDLFYKASMNYDILQKYFEGKRYMIWHKDEDELLQKMPEQAYTAFTRLKTEESVRHRLEFLKKINATMDHAETQKQNTQNKNKMPTYL